MTDILRKIAIGSLIITSMVATGIAFNNLIPWNFFGYFFAIIRLLLAPVDFVLDTNTMITLIGVVLFLETVIWGIRAFMSIISVTGWNK